MFFNPHAAVNKWGYFTDKNVDCTSRDEMHDTNGDGIVEGGHEVHCIPNGDFWLSVKRRYYTGEHLDSIPTIFRREVAMLDTLGSIVDNPATKSYHDVHVPIDLVADPTSYLVGNIRAGHVYREIDDSSQLYSRVVHDTVASGDTLWLIATYVPYGTDNRVWYGSLTAVVTSFNPQHNYDAGAFGGGVNSVPTPGTRTKPFLHQFVSQGGTRDFRVVGRVVEPFHSGMNSDLGAVRLSDSLIVTVVGVRSCFGYTGALVVGQAVTFDAACSSGVAPLEFSWNFGDNTPQTAWTTSAGTTHSFTLPGTYNVTLSARRQARPSDADDSTRVVTIVSALADSISGPEFIYTTGSYTWEAHASGGQTPYHYQWYYKQGGTETPVGSDSPSYTRTVVVGKTPFTFRLRNVVTDATQQTVQRVFWVEVLTGGGGLVRFGALDATGACVALPTTLAARQAALTAIAASGRWPTPCLLAQP